MIKYKKAINIIGWILALITTIVYLFTMEPTLSFWDCGEYIATSSKLQVGHPPGAPLYQLLGAFFSIFTFGNAKLIAPFINGLSAISSGITICFLFWIIVRLLNRFTIRYIGNIIAAIIGALTFAFTDSFWTSAIEAEVYALSTLLTAITFWAMLKWDEDTNPKWILLITYLIGLSIGIHMLNLLIIPCIFCVYYYRRKEPNSRKLLLVLFLSFITIAFIMFCVIPFIIWLFEKSVIIYVALALILIALIIFSHWKKKPLLNTIVLSFSLFLIGFSTFFILTIRAGAGTPINEYSPSTSQKLRSYLSRDAYEDTPLFYGPFYTALPPVSFTNTDKGLEPKFHSQQMTVFPRMWNYTNSAYEMGYVDWVGQPKDTLIIDGEIRVRPSYSQNLMFFASYQVGYMYVRYLLWNFVGRNNDVQGFGDYKNGSWISGIKPIDELINLEADILPSLKNNKAHNVYFGIPFLLAIIGLFYQLGKDSKAWVINSVLFLSTSLAIVVYLNQYAYQARERDYVFTVSFMVFCIWLAMGAFALSQWFVNIIRIRKPKYVLPAFMIVPLWMFAQNFDDHNRSSRYIAQNFALSILESCQQNAILFTNGDNDTFPLWYMQNVEGVRKDVRVINIQLLNSPQSIAQLQSKIYESEPIMLQADSKVYNDINRNISLVKPDFAKKNLKDALQYLYNESEPTRMFGTNIYSLPTNKLFVVSNNDTINFILKNSEINKSNMIVLDIIANNIDNRAIYFSTYSNEDFNGMDNYLKLEGFVYRLSTKENHKQDIMAATKFGVIDTDKMYKNLISNFSWKNFDKKGVYYDELNRSIIDNYAIACSQLSHALLLEKKNEQALTVANLYLQKLPLSIHNYPYSLSEIAIVFALLEDQDKAKECMAKSIDYFSSNIRYYLKLNTNLQSQNRLEMQKIMSYWIYLASIAEELGTESIRVQLADPLFEYISAYAVSCHEQLRRLYKDPIYYHTEIERLLSLLDNMYSFAARYEEKLPPIPEDLSQMLSLNK